MLLNRNRSELHFFSSYERLICSEELGNRHQTPTLIGCMLLTIRAVQSTFPSSFLPSPLRSAKPSIMTDFLKLCPAALPFRLRFAAFAASRRRHQRSPRFYTDF